MNKHHIILLAILLLGTLGLSPEIRAQGRPLPILERNPDARSAAMGNVSMLSTERNHLYVNPASILFGARDAHIDYGMEIPPAINDIGRELYYNANLGYRFLDRHAAMVGFRYLGGLEIPKYDPSGNELQKKTKPFDWIIDLGYAFKLNNSFGIYATTSFIQSYVGRVGYAWSSSLGAAFSRELSFGEVNAALKVADIGMPLAYSSKDKYTLPGSVQFGADLKWMLAEDHRLTFGAGAKKSIISSQTNWFHLGAGAEYSAFDIVSARVGYDYGLNDSGAITSGLGVAFKGFALDGAYRMGIGKYATRDIILSAGYSFSF